MVEERLQVNQFCLPRVVLRRFCNTVRRHGGFGNLAPLDRISIGGRSGLSVGSRPLPKAESYFRFTKVRNSRISVHLILFPDTFTLQYGASAYHRVCRERSASMNPSVALNLAARGQVSGFDSCEDCVILLFVERDFALTTRYLWKVAGICKPLADSVSGVSYRSPQWTKRSDCDETY